MRFDTQEKAALKYALQDFKGKVLLFGSRLDDSAKGGDIDIMLIPNKKINSSNSGSISVQNISVPALRPQCLSIPVNSMCTKEDRRDRCPVHSVCMCELHLYKGKQEGLYVLCILCACVYGRGGCYINV